MKEERTEEHCVGPDYPRNCRQEGNAVAGSSLRSAFSNSSERMRGARLGRGRSWIAVPGLRSCRHGYSMIRPLCSVGATMT